MKLQRSILDVSRRSLVRKGSQGEEPCSMKLQRSILDVSRHPSARIRSEAF